MLSLNLMRPDSRDDPLLAEETYKVELKRVILLFSLKL